ncbi:uncharacterized protein [Trachinotus anak]|uniref:uncharacterized protein n=1 Tax=Trachinotus anak TaxID=443729 RepID=UPI0039F254CA
MTRMSGRVTSCCVFLFLTLTSVSAVKKLNSIHDLKKINFGHSVSRHSLLLLHWFANIVDIDRNNVIHLTFDPYNRDYGSHHYGNYERLLDSPPPGHQYHTVGNLNQITAQQLPDYVFHPPAGYAGRNEDRIIFSVGNSNTGSRVSDRVYLTQHYDPAHTYEITVHLLREIREFSVGENQQSLVYLRNRFGRNAEDFQLEDIRNTCGQLACLGLLLFIVMQEKYSSNKFNYRPQQAARRNTQPDDFVVNFPESRQNYVNTDTSDICTDICTCVRYLFIFFVFVIVILIIFSSGMKR